MSLSEEKKILLSQLVDGELPPDQANQVLGEIFGELVDVLRGSETGMELNAMLRLRQAIEPWRRLELPPVVTLPSSHPIGKIWSFRRQAIGLAAAAVLGGILAAGGFFLGERSKVKQPFVSGAPQPAIVVSPEQRQEIANVFALHESVAGPLSWYAADDSTIQVAPAGKGESLRQPIAVVFRLIQDSTTSTCDAMPPKTYVIVCRNSDPATIELPPSALSKAVRLRLFPTLAQGHVNLQYTISADGSDLGPNEAATAGSRMLGLDQTALGQLALNDRLVNIDASAWVIDQRNNH